MLELNESYNGYHMEMPIGEEFELRLPEDPTTGYQWSLRSSGEPVCMPLGNDFKTTSGQTGQGGNHYWHFQAAQAGNANIELVYQRPWEEDEKQGKRFSLHVRVPE